MPVALLLGVAFFFVPFVEMVVIFAIGPRIGWDTTLTLLVLFSAAGAWLVKREGLDTWRRVQDGLNAGRMPTTDVVDGFLVLMSGILLLCPGFVTSTLGILLLLPPVRALARGVAGDAIRTRVSRRIRTVGSRLNDDPISRTQPRGGAGGPRTTNGAAGAAGAQFATGTAAGGTAAGPFASSGARPSGGGAPGSGDPHRAYRRPDEHAPESERVWGARVRNGRSEDFDVIDLDGEEIVFGQGELGPSGF
jgi:UPF0716 protein FxsA